MKKIHSIFINISDFRFITLTSFLGILLSFILNIFFIGFFNETFSDKNLDNYLIESITFWSLISGIFISPFIETFLFQYLFIVVLGKRLDGKHLFYLIVLSSLIFASLHIFMSFYYGVSAFLMGLYFGYIAVLSDFYRTKKISTLLTVYIVHASINASVLIPRYILSFN